MPTPLLDNRQLGPDVARLNLLTNGGFQIWQRGTGPFASSSWTADRWYTLVSGTDTMSVQRGGAGTGISGTDYSAQVTHTVGTGAGVGGLSQSVRLQADNLMLQGMTLSFSAWVNTSTANAVRLQLLDYTNSAVVANSTLHPGGGYRHLTVTGSLSSGTCQDLRVQISCTATASYNVCGAMLVAGSQPADYVPMHPADDLARCLRYYEILGTGSDLIVSSIATAASQGAYSAWPLRAIKP